MAGLGPSLPLSSPRAHMLPESCRNQASKQLQAESPVHCRTYKRFLINPCVGPADEKRPGEKRSLVRQHEMSMEITEGVAKTGIESQLSSSQPCSAWQAKKSFFSVAWGRVFLFEVCQQPIAGSLCTRHFFRLAFQVRVKPSQQ